MLFNIHPKAFVLTPRGWLSASRLSHHDFVFAEDAGFISIDELVRAVKPEAKAITEPYHSEVPEESVEVTFKEALEVIAYIHGLDKTCLFQRVRIADGVVMDTLTLTELSTPQKDYLTNLCQYAKWDYSIKELNSIWEVQVSIPQLTISPVGLDYILDLDSYWPQYYRALAAQALKWDSTSIANPFIKSLLVVGGSYQETNTATVPESDEVVALEVCAPKILILYDNVVLWMKGEKNA